MSRSFTRVALLCALLALGCGAPTDPTTTESTPPEPTQASDAGPALTYSELFDTYFAPGTPGHCATAGCHADPGHTVWRCGPTKDDCYNGMLDVGLIDQAQPARSALVDVHRSPLVWINPAGGDMPLDAQRANAAGREALIAWVAAGAQNN